MQLAGTPRALRGELLDPDPLTTAAHEIENICEAEAHARVAAIVETSGFDSFRLGGLLARIHREKWYVGAGHADFRAYVEQRHGFRLRKALYLVSIYESVIELGLGWQELQPVGWSKLKELVGVIDKHNAREWLATATADGMTVLKLHALVKQAKGEGENESGTPRRIAGAMTAAELGPVNGSDDGGGRSEPLPHGEMSAARFKAHMAEIGWEATLAVFEQNFPDLVLTVEEN
jgi:hypothetical protein